MRSPSVLCERADSFVYLCVCVYIYNNIHAPFADVQNLLKGDNFPLITLMDYSAAILSIIWLPLGRATHTLHMLAGCQANRLALITENVSYEEMKREMSRQMSGERKKRKKMVSTL